MPGDFVENDIDNMMNSDELSTDAIWTDAETSTETGIVGMFDSGFIDIDPVTGEVGNIEPQYIVKKTDVTGIKQGDTITVGTIIYRVKNPIPSDSDNLMTVMLNKVV